MWKKKGLSTKLLDLVVYFFPLTFFIELIVKPIVKFGGCENFRRTMAINGRNGHFKLSNIIGVFIICN
jgi:hypothetical protein